MTNNCKLRLQFLGKLSTEDLETTFGKSAKFKKSVAQTLSVSNTATENPDSVSNSIDEAYEAASYGYEYGTCWGNKVRTNLVLINDNFTFSFLFNFLFFCILYSKHLNL